MQRQVLATRAGCPGRARRIASQPAARNCRRDVVSRKRGDASRIDDQKNSFEYYIILIIPQQMHTLSILDWEELRGIVGILLDFHEQ